MSKHTDMMRELLAKKKGSVAFNKNQKEAAKTLGKLKSEFKHQQSQVTAPPIVKTTARGS